MHSRLKNLSTRVILVFALVGGYCWFVGSQSQDRSAAAAAEYYFHHDHVLGTSLDLWVTADSEAAADRAEKAILDEIERLRRIFSTYDPDSEISRLNRAPSAPMHVSAEMMEVVQQYEIWQARSQGAFNGQLGALVPLWQDAEKRQREPDDATLSPILQQLRQTGWQSDPANQTMTRLTEQPLNLNAIGKGYIIQKAAEAARAKASSLRGLLLNLGGDMAALGTAGFTGFTVGVQDPRQPQDNAAPIALVHLRDRAIATSGGYERYYTINGKRHSHIFDPRSGRSAEGAASATVIARDNVTANALATTLCVLTPEEGLRLVETIPGAECLLITRTGAQLRSAGFHAFELPRRTTITALQDKKEEKKANAWPDDFQVTVSLTLPTVASKRYRRPYVAVWVENTDAKPVRTISVWGNNPRWIKDLPQWWKFARNDGNLFKAVSRATRPPGKYTVLWDGKDDKGNPLPQGTYTLFVEVHREHGKLVRQTGKLVCAAEAMQLTLESNAETGATLVQYAKKKAP